MVESKKIGHIADGEAVIYMEETGDVNIVPQNEFDDMKRSGRCYVFIAKFGRKK